MAMNDDQKLMDNGRKSTLVGKIPEAELRDRSPKKLVKKLGESDLNIGQQVVSIWNQGNANRVDWLDTQTKLMQEFEEFITPIYQGAYSWSSTIHLPVAYTICRTFHSRMMGALLGFDPPFTVTARKEANTERAPLVQDLLRYTIKDWANNYRGIDDVIDRWLWHWVTSGRGILKVRWERQYSKIVDVVSVTKPGPPRITVDDQGMNRSTPTTVTADEEQETVITVFDGPQVDMVLQEDILIVGGDGDVNRADAVIHQQYLTASELLTFADQGIFEADEVDELIKSGASSLSGEQANTIKQFRNETSQAGSLDISYDEDRYQVLEAYLKKDVDGSGIATDIVVWIGAKTGCVLRASYLHRLSQSGQRPFANIDFHRRTDTQNPVGLVELTYSLTKEMDSIHNMRLDFGLLTTLPFGFYKANSSLSTVKIPIEPGAMIPVDNPQMDVFFPNLGNRTSWGMQEEASIYSYVERMTSVSDLSLGVLGSQGASRTATGARIVNNENNSNLDVYLRRMNRGFKQLMQLIFEQVQMRISPGMEFKLLGDSGDNYFTTVQSRSEIAGSYDFELESSSSASNKQIQVDTAQQIYQMTANPLDIQLGIITPNERFQAIKNLMQAMGVKSWSKFIKQPDGYSRRFSPEEIANRVLAGIDIKLGPEQDLQGFVDYVTHIFDTDELMGQFKEPQVIALARKMQEAQGMIQALQQMAAQQANSQQMQNNAAQSTQQTNVGGSNPGVVGGGMQ